MKLRRIEVRDFRKLSHVVIDDLRDGLNVVVGDNEAGKSTLLAALRAALFERHRVGGEVAALMQPYGQTVRPEIWLNFDKDGASYRLHKAFCQRQEAELIGGGERWTGDAVEDKLADLFGFTPPGRGESKPDQHHGIFGLLWVEQGTSHRALSIGAGRNYLASALETELGQITGGDRGRALLEAAEMRHAEFWDKRGNPRGNFKALMVALEADQERHAFVEGQIRTLESRIVQLADLQAHLARYIREDTLKRSKDQVVAAEAATAKVAGIETEHKSAVSALQRAQLQRDAVGTRADAREALTRRLDLAASALKEAQHATEVAGAFQARLDAAAGAASEAASKARECQRLAAETAHQLEQALSRRQMSQGLLRLRDQLTAVEAADAAHRAALSVVDAISLKREDLGRLEGLRGLVDQSRARRDAASVHISLRPDGARVTRIEGLDDPVGEELTLSSDTTLALEGFGHIHIQPGGGIEQLVRGVSDAESALGDALVRLGQPDLASVRAALQRQADARSDAALQEKTVKVLAPDGIEPLRRQALQYEAQLASAIDGGDSADIEPGAVDAARRDADLKRSEAGAREANAKQGRAAADKARIDLAVLDERVAQATRDHGRLRDDIAAARLTLSDADLAADLTARDAELAAVAAAEAAARMTLAAADPEVARLALQKSRQAEAAIRDDIDKLERDRRDLDIELRALGKDGLGELLAELEGRIAYGERQLQTTMLEAGAAKLLFDQLSAAQRETKDRWLAPVRERSAPYLRLLQPDSTIVLHEDTLELHQIVRNGVREAFECLSIGAREQIAVITRLALADILRDAGRSSCVVLDDALVNTDEPRLDRMHLVLHKAAERQQILILTCRERDFLHLGAPIRRM
ncbi:MAG: AAA family ATPase [Gammaproteobacteria bacterium]